MSTRCQAPGPVRPAVMVCTIGSLAEARLAIAEIAADVAARPSPVQAFLLTGRQTAAGIVARHRACRTTTLQLVDPVPRYELAHWRSWRHASPRCRR